MTRRLFYLYDLINHQIARMKLFSDERAALNEALYRLVNEGAWKDRGDTQ